MWHCAIKIIRKNKARHVIIPSGQHHKPSKTIKSNVPCMISTHVWFTTIDCSHTRTNLCHIFFTCTHCWSSALSIEQSLMCKQVKQTCSWYFHLKWWGAKLILSATTTEMKQDESTINTTMYPNISSFGYVNYCLAVGKTRSSLISSPFTKPQPPLSPDPMGSTVAKG